MSVRRGYLAVLLLMGSLPGCSTWRLETASPRDIIEQDEPAAVRLTGTEAQAVVILDPRVTGDSISGTTGWRRRTPTSVPIDDVRRIEVREPSPSRTAGLIGLPLLTSLVSAVLYLACCMDGAP
ncbi:MAG: hypothetical protein AB7T31_13835 [Gemmatimonadales bacterium]